MPLKAFTTAILAGQYFDKETGLHYNYHRYYDPEVGRYNKTDPIGFEGGINLYAYVLNRPVNHTDPKGLVPPVVIAIGACLSNPPCAAALYTLTAATVAAVHNLIISYRKIPPRPGYVDYEQNKKNLKKFNQCPEIKDAEPEYLAPDNRTECERLYDAIRELAKKNPNDKRLAVMIPMYVATCGPFDATPGSGDFQKPAAS